VISWRRGLRPAVRRRRLPPPWPAQLDAERPRQMMRPLRPIEALASKPAAGWLECSDIDSDMTKPLHSGWRHLELLFGRRQKEQALLQSSRHRDADLAGKMIVAAARKPQVASFGIESHPPAARHSITARCDARAIAVGTRRRKVLVLAASRLFWLQLLSRLCPTDLMAIAHAMQALASSSVQEASSSAASAATSTSFSGCNTVTASAANEPSLAWPRSVIACWCFRATTLRSSGLQSWERRCSFGASS
jgi:hypothetical protein